jgi:hypothetical protein
MQRPGSGPAAARGGHQSGATGGAGMAVRRLLRDGAARGVPLAVSGRMAQW